MKELRPCKVKERSGLFHTWEQYSDVLPPSPLVGGHGGGVIANMFALVEFEDGSIERCEPYAVKFTDKDPPPKMQEAQAEKKQRSTVTHTQINCPFCSNADNENATLYADGENKEYFVYCEVCNIETADIYKTKKKALQAFIDGETRNVKTENTKAN